MLLLSRKQMVRSI